MLQIKNEGYKISESGDIMLESLVTGEQLAIGSGALSYVSSNGSSRLVVNGVLTKPKDKESLIVPTEKFKTTIRHLGYKGDEENLKHTHDVYIESDVATVNVRENYAEDALKVEIILDESLEGELGNAHIISVAVNDEEFEENLEFVIN